MKLTDAQKEQFKKLGLVVPAGDDVPDALVESMIDALVAKAALADGIVAASRAECLRVATLALGDKDGKLPETITNIINGASTADLAGLTQMYDEQAKAKFPLSCQKCGSSEVKGRSSVEDPPVQKEKTQVADTDLL